MVEQRPSTARRDRLKEDLSVPLVSNFFQLERYYSAADTVYASFEQAFLTATAGNVNEWSNERDHNLDIAYVYGMRYCRFLMEQLPNHGYFGAPKYKSDRQKHTVQMQQVVSMLEKVADQMDTYEKAKQEAAAKRAQEEALKREKEQQARLEQFQNRFKQQQNSANGSSRDTVAASALDKLQRLGKPQQQPARVLPDPSGEEPKGQPSSKYSMPLSDEDDDDDPNRSLPPPVLPSSSAIPDNPPPYSLPSAPPAPSAPPSYEDLVGGEKLAPPAVSDGFINGSRILGGDANEDQVGPSAPLLSYQPPSAPQVTRKPQKKVPLKTLKTQHEAKYRKFVQEKKIIVSTISTFQGRVSASTNGCTVISALVVSHHLMASNKIEDAKVVYVIDKQCGPLLKTIRAKLGLGGHALIIPSDVHDHLVDCKLLPQEKFLGAAGGNIMDKNHLEEFLKILAQAQNKAGATLFFREHVISLVKYYDHSLKTYCYDLVDSLPTHNGRATRTRCLGLEALLVLVNWYTTRKFSDSDCRHVDRNEWEDNLADVDPRVFQGFVWGDAPQ